MSEKTFDRKPQGERLKSVSCVVCGQNEVQPFWDCGDYQFQKCTDCSMIYQNPQPLFDDLQNRYDDVYFDYEIQNEENFFELMKLGLNDINFSKIEESFPADKKVMDIGCATGRLLQDFKERGYQTQGVEICSQSAEYGIAHRDVNIFIGTLEESQFEAESFDFIHSSHVIEHVPDPRKMVQLINHYLKPKGTVVLVTPNIRGFQAKWRKNRWRSAIADHIWLFDTQTLRKLLEQEGFEIKMVKTWGGIAVGIKFPGWIKKLVNKAAKKFGFGDVMLFYAVKK